MLQLDSHSDSETNHDNDRNGRQNDIEKDSTEGGTTPNAPKYYSMTKVKCEESMKKVMVKTENNYVDEQETSSIASRATTSNVYINSINNRRERSYISNCGEENEDTKNLEYCAYNAEDMMEFIPPSKKKTTDFSRIENL
ncbi:hypothetical protein PMAYCL1PPCAC_23818 [Pristionchus mayeri]|uniref:Uncharacterized protein n=1 Tax=Pristionchus mayeri TaxID=1317129 RepID=A0AAN5I633_9BILA|nr:hypothetical protein PMAYCL1PPCAC_23818 [Pristionchus mayeri]